jgi:hypothetical protein
MEIQTLLDYMNPKKIILQKKKVGSYTPKNWTYKIHQWNLSIGPKGECDCG